ncbi:chemotaxis protein CheA [Aliidiomarina maris]|uniref:Chemotaxis protein CheA n=1 Tax=Aliidiomarina maris TaxID=531312 RepID=A0A327X5G0_9GAMM|nr:chemotaxis protein CheA [Aliidiomarina maris]RAK00765.1 two-component system chemotaxis sensor kinase CheA [Aliidiomarina maris]RUO27237.1 chemotaxis protein CheA [Aliidiomarina maris]
MSFDVDEEILQDFLIEAGEILEQLSEQLVQLENEPDNRDLLNAIFRGFHTVKGGAGFLSLTELVHTSHAAENVFDTLRNGQRSVNSELMDVILQALDTINAQFAQVQAREEPVPAEDSLIAALEYFTQPEGSEQAEKLSTSSQSAEDEPAASDSASSVTEVSGDGGVDEITDDEFEALLDELHGSKKPAAKPQSEAPKGAQSNAKPSPKSNNDDITDDEFEALLDEIHGKGSKPAAKADKPADKPAAPSSKPAANTQQSNEISDDEFEALLDDLHGKGSFKGAQSSSSDAAAKASPAKAADKPSPSAPKPAPAPANEAKPAAKAASAPAAAADTTVRVDTKRLDDIMNMVGELVLVRNRLLSLDNKQDIDSEELSKTIANLDVVTGDLQGAVMKTRMQPIKKVFGRFPRVVRDLARTLKKEINLELSGEDTDLDKNLVEALADPLVHLVRNAVDHGIELPDEREKAGKPRIGNVKLAASQEGDHILLSITDDGAGMDAEKLKRLAIKRGVLDEDSAARMSNEEAYNLIFAAGFSTKEQISDVSGRGVGMDVVKTKINQLNGSVRIDSELGRGTRLEVKLPLTLAILPTLMVLVAKQTFALPLAQVSEIISLDLDLINTVDGQRTMIVRDKAIPLFYLEHWLKRGADRSKRPSEGHVVVVQLGTQQVGFVVDGLIGQEEVVIKPLDRLLQGTPGMAGATITSDGGIALILDVPSLLKRYAKR